MRLHTNSEWNVFEEALLVTKHRDPTERCWRHPFRRDADHCSSYPSGPVGAWAQGQTRRRRASQNLKSLSHKRSRVAGFPAPVRVTKWKVRYSLGKEHAAPLKV